MDVEITKSVISVTEMARMVGLSRARFYQLKAEGIFPEPETDQVSGRPVYTQELQRQCVHVRRTNCGANGKPIVFYSRRRDYGTSKTAMPKKTSIPKSAPKHAALIEGLRSLGLPSVGSREVDEAIARLFPDGTAKVDPSEVLRAVFVHLQRRNSSM